MYNTTPQMQELETYYIPINEMLHCVRTSELTFLIAEKIKYLDKTLEQIRQLTLLHDIGKCELSSSILLKQDKLSHSERHIIKKHSILSEQILQLTGYSDEDAKIVRYHHEKLDGSGYPYGITKIPLEQIISKKKLGIYGVFAIRTYFPKRFSPASLALLLLSYFSLADWYSCPSSGLFFALAQSLFACFFQ
jgi:putative nucleotidyltransferase with HDIG domain